MAVSQDPYYITFYSNGGVFPDNSTTTGEVTYYPATSNFVSSVIDTPTKEGYVFAGWSNTTNGSVVCTMDDNTGVLISYTSLYAVWELDPSTKCIFEKGAVDIIVDKIKAKDGFVDTSNDTVTADVLLEGYTAHDAAGNLVTGTATAGAAIETVNFSFVAHPNGSSGSNFGFWYINDSGQPISTTIPSKSGSFTIPVMKGCVVFADGTNVDTQWSVSGSSKWEMSYHGYGFVAVADNDITFTITVRGISKE